MIPVHCVVSAADGCDLAHADLLHLLLQLHNEILATGGRNVTTVHETVYIHLGQTCTLCKLQQTIQVGVVAVHAAAGQQTHQMQSAAVLLTVLHRSGKSLVGKEITILNGLGDPGQLLVHDTTGANVSVTNLRVAHLPIRQTNTHAGCADGGIRAVCKIAVQVRGCSCLNGIAVGVRVDAESVHDNQCNRFFAHTFHPLLKWGEQRPPHCKFT